MTLISKQRIEELHNYFEQYGNREVTAEEYQEYRALKKNNDKLLNALKLAENFIAAEVAERNEKSGEGTSTTLDIIQAVIKQAEITNNNGDL